MKKPYVLKPKFTRPRKRVTVPDQSMSIQELVRRFVKGIPSDVIQREAVYNDQSEYDMEKLARMDFSEKAALAAELSAQAREQSDELQARERARRAKEHKAQNPAPAPQARPVLDPLDNTSTDDTKHTTK